MANHGISKKIMSLSPYIEIIIRNIYWKNIQFFKSKKQNGTAIKGSKCLISFDKISSFLKDNGVVDGGLLLVHSSFVPFMGGGKNADQLLDFLFKQIGENGTLAMPAMPKFKNKVKTTEYLTADTTKVIFDYDVKKSKTKSGVLPMMLLKKKEVVRSRHPINTMAAVGPLAKILMENNLNDKLSLPCGTNSSWYNCLENDAIIVGFGLDLTHSLTSIHIAEDVLDEKWPISNWYSNKKYKITDGDFVETKNLRERRPKWGALHYAERTLCRDLIKSGVLKTTVISGVIIEVVKARELIVFLNNKNKNGYPYFGWHR